MNGVTCKCGICKEEFRITKESARKGVPGYNVTVMYTQEGLPTVQILLNVSPSEDICPTCANQMIKDSAKNIDYRKLDFVLS